MTMRRPGIHVPHFMLADLLLSYLSRLQFRSVKTAVWHHAECLRFVKTLWSYAYNRLHALSPAWNYILATVEAPI